MKKILSTIFFLFLVHSVSFSQTPNWMFAEKIGGAGDEISTAMAADAAGNVYVCGTFDGITDFDPGAGVANSPNVTNGNEYYLLKLDNAGNFVWVKIFGNQNGPGQEFNSMAMDNSGNIYLVGEFHGVTDFDPGPATHNLSGSGTFVLKLDTAGNFIWVDQIGGTTGESAIGVCVNGFSVYVTGLFQGTNDFDPGLGVYNLTSEGGTDVYVCKLDAQGNFLWARAMGGINNEAVNAIDCDAAGCVYTTGRFQYTADFDPGAGVYNFTAETNTNEDAFISKLDASGNFVWARQFGGTAWTDQALSLKISPANKLYLTGHFVYTVDFDPGPGVFNLTYGGYGADDVFILKLDTAANFIWAKRIGGAQTGEIGHQLCVDNSDDVYIVGEFGGTVDFDPNVGVSNLTAYGNNDIFEMKLTSAGNFAWAKEGGSVNGYDHGTAMTIDPSGNVFFTGEYGYYNYSPATFGSTVLVNSGFEDCVIAKLSSTLACNSIGTVLTNVSCTGGNDGSAAVSSLAGTPPYTYSWMPSGQASQTATGLTSGVYHCTVSDASGCSSTATVSIQQPVQPVAQVIQNVSCNGGSDGIIRVSTLGGAPPFTYQWSPTAQTTPTATGLLPGNYTVIVSDANSCSFTAFASITEPPILTASASTIQNVLCYNVGTGIANVMASGGTPNYTYAWSPSGGTVATASSLTANTYVATVTDAKGCTATSTTIITQPPQLTIGTQVLSISTCWTGTGVVRAIPAGGIMPYTYIWSPTGQTGMTASNLGYGTYTCTVTDANGCTSRSWSTVGSVPILTLNYNQTSVSCFGGSNGTITMLPSGGVSPYTYSWNPTGQTTQTATGLAAGTYTMILTDAGGCSKSTSVTLGQPTLLTLNVNTALASCASCNDGAGYAAASGGTASYHYAWTPSGGTTATASNLLPGNYTCCVTDAHGCSTCSSVIIDFNCVVPTTQVSNMTFSNVTSNSMTVSWTNGNGSRRLVKIKKTNNFTAPLNGVDYLANSAYSGSEQFVYNGTGNSVNITGLTAHTNYWFRVYEASCNANNSIYLTSTATNNPKSKLTLAVSPQQSPNRPEDLPEEFNSFTIIPNPAHDNFTVILDDAGIRASTPLSLTELKMYDVMGRVVLNYQISSQLSTVNFQLSAGVYFVKVSAGEKVFTQKLVVE